MPDLASPGTILAIIGVAASGVATNALWDAIKHGSKLGWTTLSTLNKQRQARDQAAIAACQIDAHHAVAQVGRAVVGVVVNCTMLLFGALTGTLVMHHDEHSRFAQALATFMLFVSSYAGSSLLREVVWLKRLSDATRPNPHDNK